MKHALSITCFLIGALLSACAAAQSVEPDAYGRWMKRPPAEWPKIALVNQIDYVDQHYPVAGCGFLLQVGDEVLAATAKHVLTYFKSSAMDSVDFEGKLESWKMFPKDLPRDLVVMDALLNRDNGESLERIPCEKDWLLTLVSTCLDDYVRRWCVWVKSGLAGRFPGSRIDKESRFLWLGVVLPTQTQRYSCHSCPQT